MRGAGAFHYVEQAACPPLAAHVRCYWSLTADANPGASWSVLPDGCADLMFGLDSAAPLQWVGTMTRAIQVTVDSAVKLFGVRFQPGGLHAFTGQTLEALTDLAVDGSSLSWRGPDGLHEALCTAVDFASRCRSADSALSALLQAARPVEIGPALGWLARQSRLPSVPALAKSVGLTTRTLERRFRCALGVSPKQHLRYLRFERAKHLLDATRLDGASIAAEADFADEAHFIHDFRGFSGLTPGAFRRR